MEYVTVLFWSAIASVFSLLGGLVLISRKSWRKTAVRFGLPFGAGALLAAAFLGVLPEAMHTMNAELALIYALGGFLAFFLLERTLGWFHHHEHHHHDAVHGRDNASHRWLVIIGDTLHNAIDGLAIGAAFLVNPAAGIGTALAVAAHEIPQEIGDFSILLGKGMKPRSVILVNVISALATVVAALSIYALGSQLDFNAGPLLAIAAGFFVYIAASDIIPDIHEQPRREGNIQAAMLLVGVFLIGTVLALTPHDHGHNSASEVHESPFYDEAHEEPHLDEEMHDEHDHDHDHEVDYTW